MDWGLADYSSHPIDGDAGRLSECASHLAQVASDLRGQITRLQGVESAEIWESGAGSADAFQDVVDDLPEKLDLVATRYERVHGALDAFHPTLASSKQDAEYWIAQAETAQSEVESAEAGVGEMEDFESNAEDGEEWDGMDHRASLDSAQGDLSTAIDNVHNAVSAFEQAAETCAEAIDDAINDDLKNDSGWFGISISWDDVLDVLEVVVDVLNVVVAVLSIVALFVPGLNLIVLGLAALVLVGTLILYANDRASGWDVAFATIGFAAAGVAAFSSGATSVIRGGRFLHAGRFGQGTQTVSPVLTNFTHAGGELIVTTVSNPAYVSVARLGAVEGLASVTGIAADGISRFRGDDGSWGFDNVVDSVVDPISNLTDLTGINSGSPVWPVPANLASAALN